VLHLAGSLLQEIRDEYPLIDPNLEACIIHQAVCRLPEDEHGAVITDRAELEPCVRTRLRNLLAFYTMTPQDYRQLAQRLTRTAYHHLRDWRHAEDAVQETFLAMYRKRDAFRGDCSYSSWINTILFSRVQLMRRAPERLHEVQMASITAPHSPSILQFLEAQPADGPSFEEIVAGREKLCKVWELIAVLLTDKHSYRALNLLFDQGRSAEETARIQGISLDHLYTRVSRARSKLLASSRMRALLEDRDEREP
jgi:RNA polymerase sigma factor (sigma-70 family)